MSTGISQSIPPRTAGTRRRAVIVQASGGPAPAPEARALSVKLGDLGIESILLRGGEAAGRIAQVVVAERADAVELFLPRRGGVLILRALLRELIRVGKRDVTIVAHKSTDPRPGAGRQRHARTGSST